MGERGCRRSRARAPRGVVAVALVVAALALPSCAPRTDPGSEPISPTTVLDRATMLADLDAISTTLLDVHPALRDEAARAELERLASALRAEVEGPLPAHAHFARAARLTASLGDAHTRLVMSADRYLPVTLAWLGDGLAVTAAAAESSAAVYDEVIAVGGRSPASLLPDLRRYVPADNDQWLRFIAADYLTREAVLLELGLVGSDGAVSFTVRGADGARRDVRLGFHAQRLVVRDVRDHVGWELRRGYGLFWLDACRDTPEYRSAVSEFFAAVAAADIDTVVLDLRRNGGGQSAVDRALLSHLPAREIVAYRVEARPSRQALPHFGPGAEVMQWLRGLFWDGMRAVPPPDDPSLVFDGELIVATSPHTFSAASDLATLLHDNGLALLVGEPTGGAPSSYGDVLRFHTPSGALAYGVSFKRFTRPDPTRDPASELVPDVPLPFTIDDLRSGVDPVARWLEGR